MYMCVQELGVGVHDVHMCASRGGGGSGYMMYMHAVGKRCGYMRCMHGRWWCRYMMCMHWGEGCAGT